MEYKFSFYVLLIVLLHVFMGCTQREDISNRVYFTFSSEDRKLIVPVELNDSIKVKLLFDTGDIGGNGHEYITLDTSVLSMNPVLCQNYIGEYSNSWGVAWMDDRQGNLYYASGLKLKIGNVDFAYAGIVSTSFQKYMNNTLYDGMFNIRRNDTAHIWELNFENNYMEVHSADNYNLPKDCIVFSLESLELYPFVVTLPLKFSFSNEDTLTIHQKFLIDTGAPWDIVLLVDAEEQELLNKREDAVWIKYLNSYIRYYTTSAVVGNDFVMDSLRIYTIDYKNHIEAANYLLGLNFLKRFNVFFDMKNKLFGLQAITNFQRLVNPLYGRFHYSTQRPRMAGIL